MFKEKTLIHGNTKRSFHLINTFYNSKTSRPLGRFGKKFMAENVQEYIEKNIDFLPILHDVLQVCKSFKDIVELKKSREISVERFIEIHHGRILHKFVRHTRSPKGNFTGEIKLALIFGKILCRKSLHKFFLSARLELKHPRS